MKQFCRTDFLMDECSSTADTLEKVRTTAMLLAVLLLPQWSVAAETWGGSFAITSDYLVRGISRSNQGPAPQADLHVATDNGFIGGVFASGAQFDSGDRRAAELSVFLGRAWQLNDAWRAKLLASYYGYLHTDSGSQYNYAELSFEAAFDDWLTIDTVYSPNAPRYVYGRGISGVVDKTADISIRTPWSHWVAATAGVGYSEYSGPGGGGYAYWSAGGVCDLAPWSISLSYVNTNADAAALFFGEAAHNRWVATVIRRF
jgi:uncharacterized protein (TIGR02001 family)